MDFAIDKFDRRRLGLVTGSKCGVLFPSRGDGAKGQKTYAKELAKQLFFQTYDEVSTWQMEHGKMAEHFAFQHYNDLIDNRIEGGGFTAKGQCAGTTDARIPGEYGIDFKCPTTLSLWLDYLYEGIDKDQEMQCRLYMYLEDLPAWEIAAYLTETQLMNDNGLTYPIPEEYRMIRIKVERNPEWETALQIVTPSLIQERDKYVEILKERFKKVNVTV
jgi:hypothetical protein